MTTSSSPYLDPYLRAAKRHGGGFGSLLWASPRTQAMRFQAIAGAAEFDGRIIADIGCGRADLLDYLVSIDARPAKYIGLEAVEPVARAAEGKGHPDCTILRADFVREPQRMFVGADVVVISGSLNTLAPEAFYATLAHAFRAAGAKLIFNFLDLPNLAGEDYLHWHRRQDVERFALGLTSRVEVFGDYLKGDCTLALTSASSVQAPHS